MKVSDTDVQNTVLQLFRARGLVAGDEILLARLEHFWGSTTLRRADLLNGIALLASRGLLQVDEHDGETCLSLTDAAERQAPASSDGGQDSWHRHLHAELLPALRQRQTRVIANGGGRRDYEGKPDVQIRWPRD